MLKKIKSIYFIGIGGISMSALAKIYISKKIKVYGSDLVESDLIKELRQEGADIKIGDAPEFVKKCDVIVINSAIGDDNNDLQYAKELDKPIFTRAQVLGELSKKYKTISVAGTHGKTTTTGMIANCLLVASRDPTIHIGGVLNNINSNLHLGKSDFLVTEACEYKDSFLSLKNFVSVVLNIEEDHLDYFGNLDNIFKSFNKFIKNTSKKGAIIYNFDEKYKKLKIPTNSISFGLDDKADVRANNLKCKHGKYYFDLIFKNKKIGGIKLPCPGKHNVLNALATCATCIFLGLSFKEIKKGIETFLGIQRRFQVLKSDKGLIFHDYAHHPKEIESTIKTCREIDKRKHIIIIFQPHTYTRTRDLYKDFINCFALSDEVWLLPIYPAREQPIENINSFNLYKDISRTGKKCRYFSTFDDCHQAILEENKRKNIIALLGAGDIYDLAKRL